MRRREFFVLPMIGAMAVMAWTAAAEPSASASKGTIAEKLIGSWRFQSSLSTRTDGSTFDRWGSHSRGTLMFDRDGNFVQVVMGPESRIFGAKSFFAFGTYKVDEKQKMIISQIEGSSNSRLVGVEQRRVILTLTEDKLKYLNLSGSYGNKVEAEWKRISGKMPRTTAHSDNGVTDLR